jgi:hypothetical protein
MPHEPQRGPWVRLSGLASWVAPQPSHATGGRDHTVALALDWTFGTSEPNRAAGRRAVGKVRHLIFNFPSCYTHHLQHHIPPLKGGDMGVAVGVQVYAATPCYTSATP